MPWIRGDTEDGEEVGTPAKVDVLGENTGNVQTTSQNVTDDVD